MNVTVVGVVTPLRDWLRSSWASDIGDNIWAGKLPADAALPAVRISRVGGGHLEPCLDRPLLQLDVFAAGGAQTERLAAELRTHLQSAEPRTVLTATLLLMGASVVSDLDLEDQETGAPRRSLTVDLTTLAVP